MERSIKKDFKKLQKLFKLQDWDIELIETSMLSSQGSVSMLNNLYQAEISIKMSLTYDEKILALIHEFVHIVLRNTQDMAREVIQDQTLITVYTREMERETDKLTKTIHSLYTSFSGIE